MAEKLKLVADLAGPIIEIGKIVAEPIKRRMNYLCCFDSNVQNLVTEARNLDAVRVEVQRKVDMAQNNAEIVVPRVQFWLEEVSKIQTKKLEIDVEINTSTRNGGRFNVGRYSLSKRVIELAEAMNELQQESNKIRTISNPPPPEAMVSINIGPTMEFDSRKGVEDEIISSLRDEGTNMVGICGMGGVGKTTMAEKVMQRAREELGFEEIVMAVVSHKVNDEKIQDDIATSLGLKWKGNSSSKAHELRQRLETDTRRSLIVIDDVWERLDLAKLGIPCSNTCKVLITSRNSHILEAIGVKKPHSHRVDALSKEEAWELFKSKAWSCNEQPNVVAVARQVVDECKCLPLALVTVAVALKNEVSTDCWKTVLQQLKSAKPSHMPEVITDVYQPLRLSYEMLKTDERKTLLLLCCLFPEDYDIHVETLANISMGLNMYQDITSLEQARYTTCFLVKWLKSSFLLLEGKDEDHVKMHDVVRDVAIFIAAEERRIKCNECTWISPNIGERIRAHGESSSSPFPNLRLLWIDRESRDKELEIHNDFFGGMRELKVIMIKIRPHYKDMARWRRGNLSPKILASSPISPSPRKWRPQSFQRLPETIGLLKNLRTLVLEVCESLECISLVGKLVNLEILICRSCRTIKSLPAEIGNLRQLRLLELSGCRKLKTIAPGVISNLRELEELIVEYFDGWEARIVEGERKNAPLYELERLSKLTRLTIAIMGSGGCFLGLERLEISDCKMMEQVFMCYEDETNIIHIPLVFPKLKVIKLDSLWRLKCFVNGIKAIEFPQLDEMRIESCRELKELVYSGIWDLPGHRERLGTEYFHLSCDACKVTFGNLSKLHICGVKNFFCLQAPIDSFAGLSELEVSGLKGVNIFSFSITESSCLSQLEKLEISGCDMMEEVILWKGEENQMDIDMNLITLFPKLKYLSLTHLPRLTSLSKGIEFHLPPKMYIENCPLLESCASEKDDYRHLFCNPHHKVKFDRLKELKISGAYDEMRKWCPRQNPMIKLFSGVCRLSVTMLNGMESLFPCLIAQKMENIKDLDIFGCREMVRVIEDKVCESTTPINLFPKLETLSLSTLPKLISFCEWRCGLQLDSLLELSISMCNEMKELTSGSLYTPNLQTMYLDDQCRFDGKDVGSPLQLSSLRKIVEKQQKHKRSSEELQGAEASSSSIQPWRQPM